MIRLLADLTVRSLAVPRAAAAAPLLPTPTGTTGAAGTRTVPRGVRSPPPPGTPGTVPPGATTFDEPAVLTLLVELAWRRLRVVAPEEAVDEHHDDPADAAGTPGLRLCATIHPRPGAAPSREH